MAYKVFYGFTIKCNIGYPFNIHNLEAKAMDDRDFEDGWIISGIKITEYGTIYTIFKCDSCREIIFSFLNSK